MQTFLFVLFCCFMFVTFKIFLHIKSITNYILDRTCLLACLLACLSVYLFIRISQLLTFHSACV